MRKTISFGEDSKVVYDPLCASLKKCINFDEDGEQVIVFDNSHFDKLASWYTLEDYEMMRHGMCTSCVDDGGTRGLELYGDTDLCEENRVRRQNHVQSILTLQEEHKENGLLDAKGLKMMSSTLSRDATKAAQQRALEDSIEAYQLHKNSSNAHYLKAKNTAEYAKKSRSFGRTTGLTTKKIQPPSPTPSKKTCHCKHKEKNPALEVNHKF